MPHSRLRDFRPGLPLFLLGAFLSLLWIAGGSSRGDAAGQILVRGGAALVLVVVCLAGKRPVAWRARPVWLMLSAALLLTVIQLIPLPPGLWQALPGHDLDAAAVSGQLPSWRPLSISPGATVNAAFSLIVPFTVLVLVSGMDEADRAWLPGLLLGIVTAGMLVGLLQFSGASFSNPLINDEPGQVSGTFANRNHFAVFLAMGCLIAPVWAFLDGRQPQWRAPVALGLVILFTLTILASGSRAGFLTGGLALGLGLAMVWRSLRRALRHYPRWIPIALVGGAATLVIAFVLVSVLAGRAVSIDRAFVIDQGQDMRTRGLPTVLAMTREYFPFGSGVGAFDPVFRLHEPFALLKPTYFNHAHNDLLEVVLDGGLPGLLLLGVALGWWAWASERAWHLGTGMRHVLPKLGSAILLLVIFASAFDYPVRTPMMMAMTVIAAVWLSQRPVPGGQALPTPEQPL